MTMRNTIDTSDSKVPLNQHLLNQFEQYEVLSKACLSLALKAPADDATLEEREKFYRQQHEQILSFVNLLHDSLVSEHGKVLLCLYQCE